MSKAVSEFSRAELTDFERQLENEYAAFAARDLKLDMSRGKPAASQLDLNLAALDKLDPYIAENGVDARNYGVPEGLTEMRRFFGEVLNIDPERIVIGGNSSLNLMYDQFVRLLLFGTAGQRPWREQTVKFLCPSPGYDRHFAICEDFGIEMITIPMTADGPDMDQVEQIAAADPAVKGIWCVPLYSNPQGICYSDTTVQRLAAMTCAAPDFRIFWDNAYGVHHLYEEQKLADIFAACDAAGNPDRVYYFFSTSKITFPGSGVAMIAASPANRKEILARMSVQTIGHDKLNQLRTLHFLRDAAGLRRQMERMAGSMRPKFDIVAEILERELSGSGLAEWTNPRGGYFVALDTMPGCAQATVDLAREAGLKMTPSGASFPYHRDPQDRNIRIAPTYLDCDELRTAMELFTLCVKLAGVRKLLAARF